MNIIRSIAGLSALGGLFCTLAACTYSSADIDSVTFGAGEAVRHNWAVQSVDPWPSYAWQTSWHTDSSRLPPLKNTNPVSSTSPAADTSSAAADTSDTGTP